MHHHHPHHASTKSIHSVHDYRSLIDTVIDREFCTPFTLNGSGNLSSSTLPAAHRYGDAADADADQVQASSCYENQGSTSLTSSCPLQSSALATAAAAASLFSSNHDGDNHDGLTIMQRLDPSASSSSSSSTSFCSSQTASVSASSAIHHHLHPQQQQQQHQHQNSSSSSREPSSVSVSAAPRHLNEDPRERNVESDLTRRPLAIKSSSLCELLNQNIESAYRSSSQSSSLQQSTAFYMNSVHSVVDSTHFAIKCTC